MAAGSKEARLIMRLVDGVSGPAKAISGALGRVNASTKALAGLALAPTRTLNNLSRSMRHHAADATVMSAAVSIGLTKAAEAVYAYEKEGNRMEAFGLLNEKQRATLEKEAMRLNKFFPQTNKGILEAASELFRAGLTYEQALGALEGSLQLSLAGDIETKQAADIATNIMYAMKMPMATMEEVQKSLAKVNDLLAYGATKSNTDIKLMSDTFRYVAPLAATAGMSIEQVTGLTMDLAKAGIKGAEAGVALRSGLVRMAKPTKPMIAAFNRLNINMKDFVQYKQKIEASTLTSSLLAEGYDLTHLNGQIQKVLDDKSLAAAPQRLLANLTNMVVGEIGDETVRDKVSETLQDAIVAGGQKVDLVKLLNVLKEKGATITDISQIFDVRMGSRLAAILYNDLDSTVTKVVKEHEGVAADMSQRMTKGIVGFVLDLDAALENAFVAVSKSGVLDDVGLAMRRMSGVLNAVSDANPQFLKLGTYAAIALAALAPLGFAASGIAASLALMVNPLSWVVAGFTYFAAVNFQSIGYWLKAFGKIFTDNLSPKVLTAFGKGVDYVKDSFKALTSAGRDGSAWAYTAKNWAEAAASAINTLYDIGEKIANSRFVSGFKAGFVDAFDTMASVARKLAESLKTLGVETQPFIDFLNTDTGEKLGKWLGEISGYGAGLAIAAVGISLAAAAIGSLGRALKLLTGAEAGMAVLGGLAGMFGLGGGGKGGGGKGGGLPTGKTPGKFPKGLKTLGWWGAIAAGLGYAMYELKDYEGGVWNLELPKPRPNALADYIDAQHPKKTDSVEEQLDRIYDERYRSRGGPLTRGRYRSREATVGREALETSRIVDPSVDTSSMDAAAEKADETGKRAREALSITVKPIVDTSSIDAFMVRVGQAAAKFLSLGGGGSIPALHYTADHGDSSARPGVGARASGGAVRRGLTYEINEKGTETVTMGVNGYVTPAHRAGEATSVNVGPVHIHGANADEVLAKLGQTLNRALTRSRQLSLDGRPVTT